jgi:O-antigen/teichoic acid export membrane protein
MLSMKKDNRSKLRKESVKIVFYMVLIVIIFVFALPLGYHLAVSKEYWNGLPIARIIGLGFLFQGLYFLNTNYIFYSRKTYFLSALTGLTVASVMLLNYILVPKLGMMGSAYAMLFSWCLLSLVSFFVAQRLV